MAGNSRSTVPCVQLMSSLRSMQPCTIGVPSIASSMPIITPSTRTSRTNSHSLLQVASSRCGRSRSSCRACFQQVFVLDHFDGRDAGPGGDRIAAERGRVHAGPQAGGDLGRGQQRPAGDAAAQRLGQRHDVGRDAEMLIGEPLAGAAAAGLHFVEDQQQPVLVGQLAQALQEARRAEC